ncbi:MAG: hypothetical protein AAF639_33940 [Chloroflexota bacterium]
MGRGRARINAYRAIVDIDAGPPDGDGDFGMPTNSYYMQFYIALDNVVSHHTNYRTSHRAANHAYVTN